MSRHNKITIILCTSVMISSYIFAVSVNAANPKYNKINTVNVVSIYDGDTFTVDIPGFPDIIGKRIPIRVYGIDCPEMKSNDEKQRELARKAKQRTVELLRGAKTISIEEPRLDKYFRILGVVKIDNKSLGDILIEEGLAVEYFGEQKK